MSPSPPPKEWMEDDYPRACLGYHYFWKRKEFVQEAMAKKDETWAETLELNWWLS
jgi:hypothetical protein